MAVSVFPKGRRTNYDAPADIGTRPVRSSISSRLCKDCSHYNDTKKRCKFFRKIINPDWAYCSWWKNNKEEK